MQNALPQQPEAAFGDVFLWRQFDHQQPPDFAHDKVTIARSDSSQKSSAVVETTFLRWIRRVKRTKRMA